MISINEQNKETYRFNDEECETIYRVKDLKHIGGILISFDKKTIYNLWTDYPQKFTPGQIETIRKEIPYWYNFFRNRLN